MNPESSNKKKPLITRIADKIRIPKKSEVATKATGKKFLGVKTTHSVCMVATTIQGLRKGRDGTLYAIYPDGSFRRCSPRRVKNLEKQSKRTQFREESAIIRGTAYLKPAEAAE